ncbi:MAG: VCBS repeat-containing protein, partial [Maribacter sp.]|nr:VCBS repeat-containing protein [Maribacter sp.]
ASSFYSDLKNPEESFVYLNNNGQLNFTASFLPEAAYGKWITMEVGDLDNDGLLDVMLGSFLMNFTEMGKVFANTGTTTFPQGLLLTQMAD